VGEARARVSIFVCVAVGVGAGAPYEAGRVVVLGGARIAKRLQEHVGVEQLLLDGRFLAGQRHERLNNVLG
jgi:hypothetical protein